MALAGLPFAEFLAVLQARGIPIGIPEHQDLGKLLQRFEHARRDELRDSIAALLARNHEDLQLIRALFDDLYPPVDPPSPPARVDTLAGRRWLRRLGWAALGVLLLALLAFAAWWRWGHSRIVEPPPPATQDTQAPRPQESERPPLPKGQVKTSLRPLTDWLALGFGGLFVALWLQRMRFARTRQTRTLRDAQWQALRGPDVFRPQPPQPPHSIARDDVEEFATLLSLLCAEYDQGSAIDIDRSVEQLARTGFLLQPAQLRSLLRQPIVVLQDRSLPSALFAYKADALVHGLQRGGVPIYRYFFSGRADRVKADARSGSRDTLPLTDLLRLHPGAPLFVISLGTGISDADAPWLEALATVTRRAWLLPLSAPLPSSQRLRALFPQRIFALHRGGLRGVAYAMAQDQDRRPGRRIVAHGARHATQHETTRLLRRLAFLPLFDLPLADWLRQRCCPDVPESALLSLLAHCEGVPGSALRLSSPDRERLQRDLQAQEPDELAPLRRALIEIFQSSEPAEGSLAHLRWQLALSTQRLHSSDAATEAEHDRDQLARHLRNLQESPLAPELQAVLRQADPQRRPTPQPLAASSAVADSGPSAPLRLAAPGLREVLLASIGTALLAGLLLLLGQGRIQPAEPIECLKIEVAFATPDPVFKQPPPAVARVTTDCGDGGPPTQVQFFVAQGGEAAFHELKTQRTTSASTDYWSAELPNDVSAYYAVGQGKSAQILYSKLIKTNLTGQAIETKIKVQLDIQSEPTGATVRINDDEIGKTPISESRDITVYKFTDQLMGQVQISLAGFEPYYTEQANFNTREPFRMFVRLRPLRPAAAPDDSGPAAARPARAVVRSQKAKNLPIAPETSGRAVVPNPQGPEKPEKVGAKQEATHPDKVPAQQEAMDRMDSMLTDAQVLYSAGEYQKAIDIASKYTYNPSRAYRIIGASACNLRNLQLAKYAFRRTDLSGQQYLIYVCEKFGITDSQLRSNTNESNKPAGSQATETVPSAGEKITGPTPSRGADPSRRTTQSPVVGRDLRQPQPAQPSRDGSSEPSPPRVPARREQPVLDREAVEPRPQAPPPPR